MQDPIISNLCKEKNITVQKINESTNNLVRGNNDLIIKQYIHQKNFDHEFSILQKLNSLHQPYFPKILEVYPEHKIIIMTRLPGKNLDFIWHEITQQDREFIYTQLLNGLKEIHTIKADKEYNFLEYYQEYYTKVFALAQTNPHIDSAHLTSLNQKINQTFSSRTGENNVLLHYDFWVKNLFSDSKTITGIIDFENGLYGPLVLEGLKIYRDHLMIHKPGCEDTSDNEITFMDEFVPYLQKNYPELFAYTPEQYYNYFAVDYIAKLSKHQESWYDHSDVEYMRERVGFEDILR